jgi:SsrA-binding protein
VAKKKKTSAKAIVNRRARHDYVLGDTLVVGLSLTGAETKSLRLGHGQLQGAYVTVKEGELFLINARIHGTAGIVIHEDEQTRARKILAKRREINRLIADKQQGNTIIPLEILTQGRFIKLKIASARGKRKYDKRQTLKKREQDRQAQAAMKRARR